MVAAGERAVMLFVIQRTDCDRFAPAADLDPAYRRRACARGARRALKSCAYGCDISPDSDPPWRPDRLLPCGDVTTPAR